MVNQYGEAVGVKQMRKYIAAYLKGQKNSAKLKNSRFKSNGMSKVSLLINNLLE